MGQSNDNLGKAIRDLVKSKLAEAAEQVRRQTPGYMIGTPDMLVGGPGGNGGMGGSVTVSFEATKAREGAFYHKVLRDAPAPPSGRKQQFREERLKYAQPWSTMGTKAANPLVLQAATYKPKQLFDCPPAYYGTGAQDTCIRSPSGTYAYANRVLPRAYPLDLRYGSRRGEVFFDDDVVIPTLYKTDRPMDILSSLSPQELLTLRPGLRKAKGRVVVGGLGLGWLLTEICHKDLVGEVVLVEQSNELMDWYGHELCRSLPKISDVVIGDVFSYIKRTSRTACYILDVWKGYGTARGDARLQELKATVKNIWGWGDVQL